MKRVLLLLAFFGLSLTGFSQTQITNVSYSSSVNLFDMLEISFDVGKTYTNPYDPDTVFIYAVFVSPTNEHHHVNAFYYEGYNFEKLYSYQHDEYYEHATPNGDNGWRIRFTPTCVGNWSFVIHGIDGNGQMVVILSPEYYPFTCNSVLNAKGFISKANNRFLKRDVMNSGHRQYESFFPVGPNVAWYDCLDYNIYQLPRGIYQYEQYIDSLAGNANYMRVFLSRYQSLSLYGPEFTEENGSGDPVVYFNSTLNQKDAAELDYIISYAKQHDISLALCFFSFDEFKHKSDDPYSPTIWGNNPYNTVFGLKYPYLFFSNDNAKKIARKFIRYIVSRWGYATNIVHWELFNEVNNMLDQSMLGNLDQQRSNMQYWHEQMASYIRSIDPFHHCISTSMGTITGNEASLYNSLFNSMDFVQQHNYQNIQKAKSREQFSNVLRNKTNEAHAAYPSKPFVMEEFGFGQGFGPTYERKDPHGIDIHNSLWSSLFSTSMGPASFWQWSFLNNCGLFKRFKPILTFCSKLPIPSDSFTSGCTGIEHDNFLTFENNIETYYMINSSEDTIYGWSQDTAFAYQSLRWLTDSVRFVNDSTGYEWHFVDDGILDPSGYVYTLYSWKKPQPSSNSNTINIPITQHSVGTKFIVKWYDAETGLSLNLQTIVAVQQNGSGGKRLSFTFPSTIRKIKQNMVTNTLADAVFTIYKYKPLVKKEDENNKL